jgi:Ca2+-binding EF-hand superfamily protein
LKVASALMFVPTVTCRRIKSAGDKEMTQMVFRAALIALLTSASAAVPAQAPSGQPLPRTQFIATMDGEFRKIDADKSGLITRSEADAYQRAAALEAAAQRARTSFSTLDRDKNGQLSFSEFFRLVSTQPIATNGQQFVATMDSTRDGQVSLVEHRTATLANFDRIDADKDGIISPSEMKLGGVR